MLNVAPPILISRILTLIIAFTIHEYSHALVATYYGDETPRNAGRLTLNPLAHLDVIGSLLLLIAGFGWAKPVPINPLVLKQRSRFATMWVSLAGPLSNLCMAILAAIPIRLGLVARIPSGAILPSLYVFLINFLGINLLLMLFNLIPLAPLDGEKVVEIIFPSSLGEWYQKLRPYGPLLLLALVFILPRFGVDIIGQYLQTATGTLIHLFLGV